MPFKTPSQTSVYIRELLAIEPADPILAEIEAYAERETIAVLLPETAAFLRQAVMLAAPKRILEIGTAVGYSGILMLRAAPSATLYTVEMDEERMATAKGFFRKADVLKRTVCFTGDATGIVPCITGKFDFIFLDGPKARYDDYLPFLSRALNAGGVLFCDNVLYDGMVSGEKEIARHKKGFIGRIDSFLHNLMADATLCSSVLPVGDGVSLSIKKA